MAIDQRHVASVSRRRLLAGGAAVAGLAALAACGGTQAATDTPLAISKGTAAAPTGGASAVTGSSASATAGGGATLPGKRGGKVIWAIESDPVSLIPYGGLSTSNMWGKEFMYDSLLEWDKDLNIKPALAESYVATDDKTYTFRLRKGVKFHDGKEMDAEDVKYSFDTLKTPPPPAAKFSQFAFTSVDVVDKYTVRMTLPNADPTIPGILAWSRHTPIVPKGTLEKINVVSQGIGTGPFKLVEFVPNDRVVYTRNPDFWKPGLPYLDDLILKVLPDEQSRLAALRSGAIDGATFSADVARSIASDKSLAVLKGLTASPRTLMFTIKGEKKPWHDVRVRQAVSMTVDRQAIIDKVYGGDAQLTGMIPPGYGDWPLTSADLSKAYTVNVAAAKKLMADAGFGTGFTVTVQSTNTPNDFTKIAEVIAENLKQIGIVTTIQPLELGAFVKNIGDGTFEWSSANRGMRGDPSGFVYDFNKGTGNFDPWFGNNGWHSDAYDKLYAEALQTTDQAKRKPLYRQMQEIVFSEVPGMYTVNPMKYQAVRARVKNMYVSFTDFNTGLREAWVEG